MLAFVFSLNSQTISATVAFEERVHDFGTIYEKNGKVTHTFIFQNNGKSAVTINEIQSSCGCVGNIISKEAIQPGKKGKVIITFDPGYKSDFFSKEILVFSNNGQNFNRIWVEGKIMPMEHPVGDDYPYNFGEGLYLKLKVMAFGYLKPGETKQMELHYANDSNKEITLNFVSSGSNQNLKFSNPGKIGARQRGVIMISGTMPLTNNDEVKFYLEPYVNNKKLKQNLEIKMLNANKLTQKK